MTPIQPATAVPTLSVSRLGERMVIAIAGAVEPSSLHRLLVDLIEDQGGLSILVEIHDPCAVESQFAACLVRSASDLAQRGGDLQVRGAPHEVAAAIGVIRALSNGAQLDAAGADTSIQALFALSLTLHTAESSDGVGHLSEAIAVLEAAVGEMRQRSWDSGRIGPMPPVHATGCVPRQR